MSKKKGFTLIEMLVVVLIIGIIAAIAFPKYQLAVLRSRYTQAMVMAQSLAQAANAYYLAHGSYTLKINDLDITIPGDCTLTNNGGTIYCPKFACTVYDGSGPNTTDGYVYCSVRSQNTTLYYQIRNLRKNTIRRCFTSPTEVGKKVCESFGGRFYAGGGNGLWYYIL